MVVPSPDSPEPRLVTAAAQQPPPPWVFDAAILSQRSDIPVQFVWPEEDKPTPDAAEELTVPLIDLGGFLSGDPAATAEVSRLVAEACERHGFFQVVNHGIPSALLAEAHSCVEAFFSMPLAEKQRAQRKPGESCGYASSFTGRFADRLPWKETLSFRFSSSPLSPNIVQSYFVHTLGEDFRHFG
ncbi:putative Gibberellin 20 oxidase 1-B [Cocos nucifera]|uniref:Putative Gibberellin 20 oxidase 1-B n=1 Tax=Cocos nucifera TaxID=13894 RepID=A0A8K0IGG8_COCNU|nr:putative Gibberellin 20 oxidase 1-B [Cocos nucifera]